MSQITSQYSIQRYTGREAFDLLSAPEGHQAEWQRLIDNTLSIYGTQITDSSIPVFFTSLSENNTASRIPNINSTLHSLEPGHSYYFIMRSQANLPVVIPEVGGKLTGCDINECSKIEIQPLKDVNLVSKNNNKQFISVCASGLTCC